jgi:hypothetical protein
LMSKRNYQIPLTGGAEIRNGWMLEWVEWVTQRCVKIERRCI